MASRRIIFLGSIVLFIGLVSMTILQATGLTFTGHGLRLSRGSALSVLGAPHSRVRLNGKDVGATPLRLTRITPGTYTITIERSGYISWQAHVTLQTGKAVIVGPVTLVPTTPTITTITRTAATKIFADQEGQTPFTATEGTAGTWTIRDETRDVTHEVSLPAAPTSISRSPNGTAWAISSGENEVIWTAQGLWTIPSLTSPTWSPISDATLFGLHDGHLIAADALAKRQDDLGPATSLGVQGQTLWNTSDQPNQTFLTKRDPSTPTSTSGVSALDGRWTILRQDSKRLVLQSSTGETVVTNQFSTSPASQTHLGKVERMWWSNGETPVWQEGSDLLQLNAQGVVTLIDRWPTDLLGAWWLVPDQILLVADSTGVSARGVSAEEGQHVLGQWPAAGTFLSLDRTGHAWYVTETSIIGMSWR